MSGRTTVETEYIGNRRFFRNSYFASFAQITIKFGRRSGIVPIVVAAVAIVVSSNVRVRVFVARWCSFVHLSVLRGEIVFGLYALAPSSRVSARNASSNPALLTSTS